MFIFFIIEIIKCAAFKLFFFFVENLRNIYHLRKTFTQILKKWENIVPKISLRYMKTEKIKIDPANNPKIKHTSDGINSPTEELYQLVALVYKKEGKKVEVLEEPIKSIIATEREEIIDWIDEKVKSAISYHNETKGLFDEIDSIEIK